MYVRRLKLVGRRALKNTEHDNRGKWTKKRGKVQTERQSEQIVNDCDTGGRGHTAR
jgi:hypothetical protein